MRILLMMLLSLGLLACGNDTAQEKVGAKSSQSAKTAQAANTQGAEPQDVAAVPKDYKPAFPNIELKKWYLTEYTYNGRSIKVGKEGVPMVTIANGTISGHSGCNKFNADVALQDDGTLSIGDIAATKMLCQGKMTMENWFFELLKTANSYSVNKVFLEMEGDKGQLSFRAKYTPQPE